MTDVVPSLLQAGSVVFRGGAGMTGFFIKKVDGLGPLASKRDSTVSRPNAPGSFPSKGYPDDRTVVISGSCRAESAYALAEYESRLSALFMDGMGGKVTFDRQGRQGWFYGYRAGRPEFDVVVPGSFATYQLELWCPDPRIFGHTNTYPAPATPNAASVPAASIVAWHYGNYDAAPVYTITGSGSGYVLNGPTGFFQVTKPLVTGHPHTIDMNTGRLIVDGAVQYGRTPLADTWSIPAGQQVLSVVIPSSGVAVGVAMVPDTFIG